MFDDCWFMNTDLCICTFCVQMDPKFLRNLRYSRKHNKKGGEEVQD
jgi:hypothetical protein